MVGSDGRFVLEEACERITFMHRRKIERESYDYLGEMRGFDETFMSRISFWVRQLVDRAAPDQIEASGEEALRAQRVIEAAIKSFESGKTVNL